MTFSNDWDQTEAEKYRRVWSDQHYGDQNDGIPSVPFAVGALGCKAGESIIDWGCGNGQSLDALRKYGLEGTGFDIVPTGYQFHIVIGLLWDPPAGLEADYGFCTDVMEHIPPEHVDAVLDVLYARTRKACFIQLDTFPDLWGALMNPPEVLHLSQHSPQWWLVRLQKRWREVEMSLGAYTRWRYVCKK
jgi:hypothetical protein